MEVRCYFCRVPIESVFNGHFFADGTYICQDCLSYLAGVTNEYHPRPAFGREDAQAVHWVTGKSPALRPQLGQWVVNPGSITSPLY